jgi:hypothetical protein
MLLAQAMWETGNQSAEKPHHLWRRAAAGPNPW